MAIILKMDKQRRIRIPKKVKLESDTFLLITLGSYKILFPVPKEKPEVDIPKKSVSELLKEAENLARKDALSKVYKRIKGEEENVNRE